ncbi:hypothetical protein ACFY3G_46510 [Streptomyces phaeochromogenes]|uniref:hypothetical protein n=1 Tax=Streptomyces phaeochromogenes TaxID=1923 RepID=UPI003675C2F1
MSTPTTSPRPSQDHYLGLTGANAMATKAVAETEARILKAIKHNAMVCIHGHIGLGKTFAVHTVLRRRAPEATVRLRYNNGANMNEIRTHPALAPPRPAGRTAAVRRSLRPADPRRTRSRATRPAH